VGAVTCTYTTNYIASAIAIILIQKRAASVAPPAAAVADGRGRKPKGAKAS